MEKTCPLLHSECLGEQCAWWEEGLTKSCCVAAITLFLSCIDEDLGDKKEAPLKK